MSVKKLLIYGIAMALLFSDSCSIRGEKYPAVIELPSPDSPLITIRIAFTIGSVNDPQRKEGLNALTAMTIGQGGTQTLTYKEIIQKLYPWAASISVQYDKEMTTFIGEVHRDNGDAFYKIFSEIILNPRFDSEDFTRNKDILKNEIASNLRSNDDEDLGKQALNYLLYEGHPFEHTEMGTETGLDAITLEDVKQYYKTHYAKYNITIGLAGGYPKSFAKTIKNDFIRGLPCESTAEIQLPHPHIMKDIEVLFVEKDCIATAISLGFPIDVTRSDKDFYALMIANSYFGEHRTFNGVLMNVMREKRGLNYGDYSYIENFIQDGGTTFPQPNIPRRQQFFSIWIRPVQHQNAHFALRQALREMQKLVDNGLTQQQFEATRNFLLTYSKLYVQTASRRLGYAMDSHFYGTEFFIDKIQKELKTLTVDDINSAIKRHVQYKNIAVAIVTKDAQTLKKKLLANEPSPITYTSAVDKAIVDEDKDIMVYPLTINFERIRIVPVQEMFKK
jgi:zinc protease